MSTPDQFILMSKGIPERLPYGNLPGALQAKFFYKSSKDDLQVTRSKWTKGAPDHFPIDFNRNAFRIPKLK